MNFYGLFFGHSSLKPSCIECMAYCGPMDRYSSLCCATPSGLPLVSLLPLWLMPSLPGLWVLVGSRLLASLLWYDVLSIWRWWLWWCSIGSSKVWIFLYDPTLACTFQHLCPWLVWRAPWSSWCDASCLVVLQPLGPFRKGVFILTDHVTLILDLISLIMWLSKVIGCTRTFYGGFIAKNSFFIYIFSHVTSQT